MHTFFPVLRRSSMSLLKTCLFAIALTLPVALVAQGYFGTVSGVLTDSSGAVVQGAKVVLTDEQKGFVFNTTSDGNGRYLFASIPPGLYSVSAEMAGFEKTVRAHIKLNVSENPDGQPDVKDRRYGTKDRGHGAVAKHRDGRRDHRPSG